MSPVFRPPAYRDLAGLGDGNVVRRLIRSAKHHDRESAEAICGLQAFDAHLIGIDPDFRIHVSGRLLQKKDGPMLEALKRLNKEKLHLPARLKDRPDRERLALRYEIFKAAS